MQVAAYNEMNTHYFLINIGDDKMTARVDSNKCEAHGICAEVCPVEAITIENEKAVVDEEKCIDCGACSEACPVKAIFMED
jgi:Fe-S-cluster-containing hydrogenase component 2